jgi:hypothetical protein
MTVMIAEFFGLPHSLVREGKLQKLNGTAVRLLVFLWHESERLRTRELTLVDRDITRSLKAHRNSLAAARTELKNAGLVIADSFGQKGFLYQLCDPKTGKPWPGPPKVPIKYVKRFRDSSAESDSQARRNAAKGISNSELAGVTFPYGANAPEARVSEAATSVSISKNEVPWDEVGSR